MRLLNKTGSMIIAEIEKDYPEVREVLARVRTRVPETKRAIWEYQAAALYALVKPISELPPAGGRILEIGTALGYSAAVMAEAAPEATIITLNPNEKEAAQARKHLQAYPNVEVIEAKSWDYLAYYDGPPFDFIFVDGDHKRVRMDMPWWNHLKPGGVMFFHDYSPEDASRPCPPVYEAVHEFQRVLDGALPDILIVDDEKTGMAGFIKMGSGPLSSRAQGAVLTAHQYSACTYEYLTELYRLANNSNGIKGDIVECGVQNGGSAAVIAKAMKRRGVTRRVWLFDNFAGMPQPGPNDSAKAHRKYHNGQKKGDPWALGDPERVTAIMDELSISNVQIQSGLFKDTLPLPDGGDIALLHIDATLYASTREALDSLYGHVMEGGLIIVHAYHHWPGVKQAVDDFLAKRGLTPILMPMEKGVYWKKA